MILLPSTRQRIARLPLLFRAHDCLDEQGLFALSYGKKVYATVARTGSASGWGGAGRPWRAAGGMVRVGAEWDGTTWTPGLLLEGASTTWTAAANISDAAHGKARASVPGPAVVGPTGALDAYTLVEDSTAANTHYLSRQSGTITAGVPQSVVAIAKARGRRYVVLRLEDAANSTNRVQLIYDLMAGAVVSSGNLGTATGAIIRTAPLAHGYHRLELAGVADASATALNVRLFLSPDGVNIVYDGDGVSGADVALFQFEANRPFPSSPMPSASRGTESVYWPLSLLPQAMGVYGRVINAGTFELANARLWQLSGADNVDPRLLALVSGPASGRFLQSFFDNSVDPTVTSTPGGAGAGIVPGTRLESLTTLSGAGVVQGRTRLNDGLEVAGTASAAPASGLPTTWHASAPRFYAAGPSVLGAHALTHLAIGPAELSMDAYHDLCEVG